MMLTYKRKKLIISSMDGDIDWEKKLSQERYAVMREGATETPFSSEYNHHYEKGMYHCGACGQMLFTSEKKFDSKSGWPSFSDAIEGSVEFHTDLSYGMNRTEVRCSRCKSHLGHIFDDGPTETGSRFCINGCALDFEKE